MKLRIFSSLCIALLIFMCPGCGSKEPAAKSGTEEKNVTTSATKEEAAPVIKSSDNVCSITAEAGWKPASGLHPKAQLQASNSYGDMYLVVFNEKKDRYSGVTLDDYSEVTRGHVIKTLTNPSISIPRKVTIDGNPGLQFDIHGYVKNSKIAYTHTAVETPLYFHEIIVWTPEDRFQRNRFALESAINSFKEIPPGSETGSTKGN